MVVVKDKWSFFTGLTVISIQQFLSTFLDVRRGKGGEEVPEPKRLQGSGLG